MKTIEIEEKIHKKLKLYSEKSGIKMKVIVEAAIENYLQKMTFKNESEDKNGRD